MQPTARAIMTVLRLMPAVSKKKNKKKDTEIGLGYLDAAGRDLIGLS